MTIACSRAVLSSGGQRQAHRRRAPGPARSLPRLALLSEREKEVLRCLAQGRSNAEIASELFISAATVKTHVARLLVKLEVRDRVQLVVVAYRSGFVV